MLCCFFLGRLGPSQWPLQPLPRELQKHHRPRMTLPIAHQPPGAVKAMISPCIFPMVAADAAESLGGTDDAFILMVSLTSRW